VKQAGAAAQEAELFMIKATGFFAFALVWEILSRAAFLDPQFFPSFTASALGIIDLFKSGLLFTSMMVSLWRALLGLLIAALAAIPLAFVLGMQKRDVEDCFNPFFRMLAQVNPFSLMPVFILFFGIGEAVKLSVVAWVSFWPLFFNTLEGVRDVDPMIIKTARTMASPRVSMLFKVIFPGAAASIFTGLKLALGMSFFMLIAAEMVGANYGLGWLLHFSAMNVQTGMMYSAILATVILGFTMSTALKYISRRFFFWRENLISPEKRNDKKIHPLKKRDILISCALVFVIIALGTWQVGEAKAELARFGTETQRHHHLSMTGYSAE
jgi:NitT/TauT family transport system permease protein